MKEYQLNKSPKDKTFCTLVRNAFNKDAKENAFSKEEAAHELGMTYNTLDIKLKPSGPSELTVPEYKHHLEITGRYESLKQFVSTFGFELKSMNIDTSCSSTLDVSKLIDKAMIEFGEAFKITKEAGFDDIYKDDEKTKIIKEANDVIDLLQQLVHSLSCKKEEE